MMSQQQLKSCPLPWLYLHFPCLQLDGLLSQSALTEGQKAKERQKANTEQHDQNQDQSLHLQRQHLQKQQSLIVVNSKTNQVKQLNVAAFEQGIKIDMGIASAIALAPDLMVLDYQPDSEIRQLKTLAERLYQITADIILYQPNGLLLHIKSMLNLYGSLQNYWSKITNILHQTPIHYTWALAGTPTAARLLAKYNDQKQKQQLMPEKQLKPEPVLKALGQLSVTCLEINPKHIEQLQRLGLLRIEQLWGLSNKAIGRRFGLELLNYLQQLTQHNPRVFSANAAIVSYQPPQQYQQSIELLHEINRAPVLLFPLKRLVQEMENFLLTRQLLVHEITITLHYRQLAPTILTIASAEGEYQTEPWMRLITLKIEQCKLPDSVMAISFSCGTLVEKQRHNEALFSALLASKKLASEKPLSEKQASKKLASEQIAEHHTTERKLTPQQLVSILEAKVGKSHLFTLAIADDHRPEHAASYLPAGLHDGLHKRSHSGSSKLIGRSAGYSPIPLAWQRPTLLLHQPQPLPPGCQIITGPERVCSAWWQQSPFNHQRKAEAKDAYTGKDAYTSKDYYIGKDSYGTLCWIYFEANKGWFVQGYFS